MYHKKTIHFQIKTPSICATFHFIFNTECIYEFYMMLRRVNIYFPKRKQSVSFVMDRLVSAR